MGTHVRLALAITPIDQIHRKMQGKLDDLTKSTQVFSTFGLIQNFTIIDQHKIIGPYSTWHPYLTNHKIDSLTEKKYLT